MQGSAGSDSVKGERADRVGAPFVSFHHTLLLHRQALSVRSECLGAGLSCHNSAPPDHGSYALAAPLLNERAS